MDEKSELSVSKELVQEFPRGIFIYAPYVELKDHTDIEKRLKAALPGRAIVIAPKVPMYPQDMGVKRGERYYLGPNGLDFIEKVLPGNLGASWNDIERSLLEIRSGEEFTFTAGGQDVEVAGSGRKYTLNTNEDIEDDFQTIKCPLLRKAIRNLHKQSTHEEDLYYGHLDLLLSGCAVDGEEKLYIDEKLYNYARENGLLDEPLLRTIPVDHALVQKGGLNITYIDKTALVSSKSVVPLELLGDLKKAGYEVVEVGVEEFNLENKAGVKCRSLSLDWKKH